MKIGTRLGTALGLSALLVLVPVSAWAGGGGGGGGGSGPCNAFSEGETLVMRDNCFDGVAHFAARSSTLTVENQGEFPHSFTAVDGSFDTGVLSPGQAAEIQLGEDGIVRVVCTLHGTAHGAGMAGVLLIGNPETFGPGAGSVSVHDAPAAGEPQQSGDSSQAAQFAPVAATLIGTGGLISIALIIVARRSPGREVAEER